MRQNYTSVSAYLKDLQKEFTREYIEATRIVATRQVARLSLVTRKWKNKVVFRRQEKREKGEVIQEIIAEGTPEESNRRSRAVGWSSIHLTRRAPPRSISRTPGAEPLGTSLSFRQE
jgi:hypothetical protein